MLDSDHERLARQPRHDARRHRAARAREHGASRCWGSRPRRSATSPRSTCPSTWRAPATTSCRCRSTTRRRRRSSAARSSARVSAVPAPVDMVNVFRRSARHPAARARHPGRAAPRGLAPARHPRTTRPPRRWREGGHPGRAGPLPARGAPAPALDAPAPQADHDLAPVGRQGHPAQPRRAGDHDQRDVGPFRPAREPVRLRGGHLDPGDTSGAAGVPDRLNARDTARGRPTA